MRTKDVDLLTVEPGLFKAWRIGHQQRGRGGDGVLNGTTFTAAGGQFIAAGVQAGDVLYLASIDGVIDGCYEIVEVVSTTQLIVSVLRGDQTQPPRPVGAGSSLIWRISTFAPQRALAERMLLDRLELTDEAVAALDETGQWRLGAAMVSAALALIFESLVQQDDDDEVFGRKKETYQQALEASLVRLRLAFDIDGDGQPDATLRGDTVRMNRE